MTHPTPPEVIPSPVPEHNFDTVPEITEVVDVTDHASGSNPYFESAKK